VLARNERARALAFEALRTRLRLEHVLDVRVEEATELELPLRHPLDRDRAGRGPSRFLRERRCSRVTPLPVRVDGVTDFAGSGPEERARPRWRAGGHRPRAWDSDEIDRGSPGRPAPFRPSRHLRFASSPSGPPLPLRLRLRLRPKIRDCGGARASANACPQTTPHLGTLSRSALPSLRLRGTLPTKTWGRAPHPPTRCHARPTTERRREIDRAPWTDFGSIRRGAFSEARP